MLLLLRFSNAVLHTVLIVNRVEYCNFGRRCTETYHDFEACLSNTRVQFLGVLKHEYHDFEAFLSNTRVPFLHYKVVCVHRRTKTRAKKCLLRLLKLFACTKLPYFTLLPWQR